MRERTASHSLGRLRDAPRVDRRRDMRSSPRGAWERDEARRAHVVYPLLIALLAPLALLIVVIIALMTLPLLLVALWMLPSQLLSARWLRRVEGG